MRGRGSRSRSSSASGGREESPPDYHAIQFTISLPRSREDDGEETSQRQDQDREDGRGRRRRRRRHGLPRHDDQGLSLCFHGDWAPTIGTLELHFSSQGIHTSLTGQQPPPHGEDARVLTLECNRITFPTAGSSSFRLRTWALVGVGVYLAGITLITIAVEAYIYVDRSVLRSMEQRWREFPLSSELGRVALLYGDAASSLVDLTESAASLLSDPREDMVPLCRHAGVLAHSIESVCREYDASLTDAVGTLTTLRISASSWTVTGAMEGSRVGGLLSCWDEMERKDDDDGDDFVHAAGAVFSCVAELLRRWGDTDSAGLLSPALTVARRMEVRLRDMRARRDWIVDPFEELLRVRSASSATAEKAVPQVVSALVSAVRNKTDPELDRLLERIVLWQEAMESAGAERALLEAELSALAGAGWVTWPEGHAVLWRFPAMDRMVLDLEGTVKALESSKRRREGRVHAASGTGCEDEA